MFWVLSVVVQYAWVTKGFEVAKYIFRFILVLIFVHVVTRPRHSIWSQISNLDNNGKFKGDL